MKRNVAAVLAGMLSLTLSQAAFAWEVNWSNHRSIKVRVQNHYTEEIRILGYDYNCVNNKPEPVDIAPTGAKGTAEFEWSHNASKCDGTQWTATLGLNLKGQKKQACVIYLSASAPDVITGKVTHFQAKTDHATNCKIDISPDPKDPRDTIYVQVAGDATPRTPEPRPGSKTWWSDQCKVMTNSPPSCTTGGGGMVRDNCVYSDCRKCPDGFYYNFMFSFLQTKAQSVGQVFPSC